MIGYNLKCAADSEVAKCCAESRPIGNVYASIMYEGKLHVNNSKSSCKNNV